MPKNMANNLTIGRVLMIPVFLVLMYVDFPGSRYWALGVYIVACLTDFADGYIARHYNQVSDFGKFMDPLADKLLVCSALIAFVDMDLMPTWIVMIIIAREFIISGFRLVASDNGIVIAAGIWGKLKTVCQMVMIIVLIADLGGVFEIIGTVLIWLSLALTIISLVDYLYTNRQVLSMQD